MDSERSAPRPAQIASHRANRQYPQSLEPINASMPPRAPNGCLRAEDKVNAPSDAASSRLVWGGLARRATCTGEPLPLSAARLATSIRRLPAQCSACNEMVRISPSATNPLSEAIRFFGRFMHRPVKIMGDVIAGGPLPN